MLIGTFLDLTQNELRNVTLQNLGTAPSSPKIGQIYTNTSSAANTSVQIWMNVASVGQWVSLSTSASSIGGGGSNNQVAYFNGTNALSGLGPTASAILTTTSGSVPQLTTDIPTAVTIGGAYIYRVGGTKVAVSDGGTGVGTWTQYGLVYASATGTLSQITDISATGKALVSTNSGAPVFGTVTLTQPASQATISITSAKTFSVSNTLTLSGTDGLTVAFGANKIGGASGTGNFALTASPVFSGTPSLAAATATTPSVNDNSTNVATTAYVIGQQQYLGVEKLPVKAATASQTTISNPGTAVFDGVTLTSGQRLLLFGQSTASQNGIWVFNGSSSALTRPLDYAAGSTTAAFFGELVQVLPGGTSYGSSVYYLNTTGAITVDTTSTTWTVSNSASATNLAGGGTNTLVYQSSAGVTAYLTASNYGTLVSGATGLPAWTAAAAGVLFAVNNTTIPSFTTAITGCTYNGLTVSTTAGTLTVANNASAVISFSGNFAQTFTASAASSVVMPASTSAIMNYTIANPAQYQVPYANAASGLLTYMALQSASQTGFLSQTSSGQPAWTSSTGTPGSNVVLATSPSIATPTITGGATFSTGTSSVSSGATFNIPSGATFTVASGATFQSSNTPSAATDITNKSYVDSVAQGFNAKPTANYATATYLNATQNYTYNNGTSGVGATLTNNGAQAALTVDGRVATVGDIILVKNEVTNPGYNGLYTVTTVGSGSTNWVITRHVDMDQTGEFAQAFIPVGNSASIMANGTQTIAVSTAGKTLILSGSGTLNWTTLGASAGTAIELAGFTALTGNNGVYNVVSITTTTATNDTITYSTTFPDGVTAGSQVGGLYVYLTGVANSNSLWLCEVSGTITVGTTPVSFTQLNAATNLQAGSNIVISGNTISLSTTPTVTTLNGLTINTSAGTLAIANNASAVISFSGNFAQTFTASAASSVTMPASTTAVMTYYNSGAAPAQYAVSYTNTAASGLQTFLTPPTTAGIYVLQSNPAGSAVAPAWSSAATGSGSPVYSNSPSLTTPTLGVATATSINKVTITQPTTSATLTLADTSSLITTGSTFSTTLAASATTTQMEPLTFGGLYWSSPKDSISPQIFILPPVSGTCTRLSIKQSVHMQCLEKVPLLAGHNGCRFE